MQQPPGHQFMPPMLYGRGGVPHPGGMEMLYNQAHGHSNVPAKIASNAVKSTEAAAPPIPPLRPLSTKKSPSSGGRTAMSPLLVTAYTQTTDRKMTSTEVQTEVKETRDQKVQISPSLKRAKTQTVGSYVPVEGLQPPLLETDSKGMFAACDCSSFLLRTDLHMYVLYLYSCQGELCHTVFNYGEKF